MGEDGGGFTIPAWLIVLTVACSCGFFVAYGQGVFAEANGDLGACTSGFHPIDCPRAIFLVFGSILQFAFLGAFTGMLPPPMALILFLTVSLPWLVIIVRLIVAAIQAAATAVP